MRNFNRLIFEKSTTFAFIENLSVLHDAKGF